MPYRDVDLFDQDAFGAFPEVGPPQDAPVAPPAPIPHASAPEPVQVLRPEDVGTIAEHTGDLAAKVKRLEAECEKIAWLSAMQSAAACGSLRHFHPYEGKPLAPIEEVLRLQRVIELMRTGLSFESSMSTATQEIPIDYKKVRG